MYIQYGTKEPDPDKRWKEILSKANPVPKPVKKKRAQKEKE